MSFSQRFSFAGFLTILCVIGTPAALRADNPHMLTVMTRNMDAGTDLNYVLAASDQTSLLAGVAATLAEVKASDIPGRAARLADEIKNFKPDVIALQEVTLWRTGALLQPPATEILYDQLDLLMKELTARRLQYGVVAVQSLLDAELPVPTEGHDLRMTDRNVILARIDLPDSQFRVSNAQTHRFSTIFQFGSPLLGEFVEPTGWLSADLEVMKTKIRVVNTHLQTSGVPHGAEIQEAQAHELLAASASPGMVVLLAGDFNSNAEPGPEHTGTVEQIFKAGYADLWRVAGHAEPGFTWPLFGEDQFSGATTPNERIDLLFVGGDFQRWAGWVERTGLTPPWASDHAGVVVQMRLK